MLMFTRVESSCNNRRLTGYMQLANLYAGRGGNTLYIFRSDADRNRPRSIYQYSNMAPRLSGQTSIFGVVFFVSKSLLGIEGQRKLKNLQF